MPVRAYCDEIGTKLRGWALDDSDLTRKVELIVEINGRRELRVKCDANRDDLISHFGSSNHGFFIDISSELQNGINSVKVISLDTGELIPFGDGEFIYESTREKYIAGKDGWLFLDNDSNRVLLQLQGERNLSDQSLRRLTRQLSIRQHIAKEFRARTLNLILPEKSVVYNEYMPIPLQLADSRPARAIGAALRSANSDVSWHYNPEVLIRSKFKGLLFHKTDTHTTDLGTLILLDDLSQSAGVELNGAVASYSEASGSIIGDLGSKIDAEFAEKITQLRASYTIESVVDTVEAAYQHNSTRTGSYTVLRNTTRLNEGRLLLVFGTSTAAKSLELMATQFEYTVFCWSNHWDLDVVQELRPNVILNMISERFIPDRLMDSEFEMPGNRDLARKLRSLVGLS